MKSFNEKTTLRIREGYQTFFDLLFELDLTYTFRQINESGKTNIQNELINEVVRFVVTDAVKNKQVHESQASELFKLKNELSEIKRLIREDISIKKKLRNLISEK